MTTYDLDLRGSFYDYHFGRQLVHYESGSLLNIPSPVIGVAYSIYDAFTDTATLYDFVTDREVGLIPFYHQRFNQHRARNTTYLLPNVFVRRYYNQPDNYLLNGTWVMYQYPSCAEFLTTLSTSTVMLSYLVYNGFLPSTETVNNSDIYMSYYIPQYGYPTCVTCVKVRYPYACSEAEITVPATWYSPEILSDLFIYLSQGSWLMAARIGGLYSITGRLFRLIEDPTPNWGYLFYTSPYSTRVYVSIPNTYVSFAGAVSSSGSVSRFYTMGSSSATLTVLPSRIDMNLYPGGYPVIISIAS